MAGARGQHDAEHQDPSFLHAADGPSISGQNPAPSVVSPRGISGHGPSHGKHEMNDATSDLLAEKSSAVMGRAYTRMQETDKPVVSFHVNPDFDHDGATNSDVLFQGYEAHNRIPTWPQHQQGRPHTGLEDEGIAAPYSPSHAPRSPTSSRYPAPYEPPSPGASVRTGGMSNVLDRHYPQRSGSRRQPEAHQTAGGVSGSIAATAELSVLIDRAKNLLAHHDPARNSTEIQRLLGTAQYMQTRSDYHSGPLPPIEDQSGEVNDEELLQMHLDAKDNLRSAYAMLNDQYSAPTSKPLTIDALNELDSNGLKKSSENSDSKSDVQEFRKAAKQGPEDEYEDPVGASAVPLLTHSDYLQERETERRAKRMVRVKLFPMLLYISFILAWLLYAYVRVRHGMGGLTLPLIIYSYIVLVVEMLGGLNMIFYGCWLFAKPVNTDVFPPADRETGKEAPFRRAYNVRVMIPCYKESLAIIQRTVLASKRADRPPGMKLVIYVCDDGNDEKKLAWVQRMNDPEVKYVTGRDKSQKQLNGKSANLNFCLTKLYPDIVDPENPDELMKIPVNELMCLFDADQTCSKGFFVTMLRYIDSGDDVGVALSPQLMYNVIPDCDVFNHQNVHFWEMMQPGMDAMGFISLTGTNMILRCRALHQAGWFPMNSVTEDWALGMRFKKLGYRCRYVNQYLAIGEAPDVTQQAFQQRSRWSKGHFQVFWSRECPLFDNRLNLFFRLAYSSTCVSYLSTGLSVIVLNIVPVLTILIGWFPIALNFYTVVGITAYFGALNALSYYCLSWSHYKALWLANNSSVILFWPYLKASIFTPIKSLMGRTMVFKTTLKGAAAHNASLKVLGPSILIVLVNIVTFILGIVNFHVAVNAAQGISLCWLLFNTIPHVNLLFYSAFGPGGFMVGWCKIGMFLTTASSALAVILMWLLYPREVDFEKPLAFSLRFMQTQVSGKVPADFPVDFRMDSGLQYRNIDVDGSDGVVSKYRPQFSLPSFNETKDLSGGFYEDGPWGPVKLTKSNALATSNLAWAMLDLPGPYERDPQKMADGLAMVEHGLNYLLNCYIKDPTDYGNAQGDIYIYQVGDLIKERRRWFRPEDVTTQEKVYYTGGVAAPIDLTGQMTAGIIAGTMLLHKHGRLPNKDVSNNMMIARELFNVTMTIKGVLEHPRQFWHSDSFYDDRLWAASWMYRAATAQYLPQELASRYYTDMVDSMNDALIEENTHVVDQDYVLNMGIVHAAVNTYNWEFHAPAQTFIWDWICSGKVDYTTFGRAFAEQSPLLGDTVMAASLAQLYSIKMKGWKLFHRKFERGFQCFAQQQARYLVGTGWQRKSFIQGINQERGYDRLVHRSASCPTYPEKCAQNTGGSDSKDFNIPDGGLLWVPQFTDTPRNTRGSNSTAVSLGNNVAMPVLFAGLLEKTNSWMECLLSDGALLEHPVCSEDRPLPATDDTRLVRRQFWGRIFDEASEDTDLLGGSNGAYPLTRNLGPLPKFKLDAENFEQDLVSLLGSAWMFYEAQQSGKLTNSTPPNRIPWRGDSYINDGASESRDLSGGWYDAGDTLKLSMPFCSTVWRLAWNLITFKEVSQGMRFNEQPIYTNGLRQLAHAAKYMEKIHTTNNTLVAAVGDRSIDHLIEDDRPLVAEQFLGTNVPRPVIMLNQTSGGADLIAEACSAFAALGILFRDQDPDYSNLMIKHARQLYDWMVLVPGTQYSRVHPQLQQTYPSEVPHAHMMLAAAWMFRLTGESKFESAASSFHSRGREQQINPVVGWNNPLQDAKLLLLEANPNSETTWLPGLQEWVDSQMFGDSDGVSYSRKGLWFVDSANWGVLRNAANMANIAMRTAAMVDRFGSTTDDAHMVVWAHHARCLARQQMNYIMGSGGRSFVTGWGRNPPKRPHHRGASCAFVQKGQNCTGATWNNPNLNFPNVLPGGLVGGPTQFDEYRDSHLDFKQSEVSLDYNAALVSAVSSMTAMPTHFWTNTNFCPKFPIPKVKWLDITVKPVPGVSLPDTPEDGALIL